jgi:PPM family protein phosphatase
MDFLRKLFGVQTLSSDPSAQSVSAPEHPARPTIRPEEFQYVVGVVTDRGSERADNEDAVFCFQSSLATGNEILPFGLFVIADGLGGHEDGQLASSVTARVVAAQLLKNVYLSILEGRAQDSGSVPINESLIEAVSSANRAIRQSTNGGGSTVIAVMILGRTAYIAHVGDSRAYIIDGAASTQVTHDHSLVARLIDLKQLSEAQAMTHPQRHILYKALGQVATPEPDVHSHTLNPGAHLVLCTDGLWTVVPKEDLAQQIAQADDPQAACNELLKLALARGSDDNVSIVLLSSRS